MELIGLMVGAYALVLVVQLAIVLWVIIALGGLFRKAGEPAWKAWVPFLNQMTYLRLGGMPTYWAFVLPIGLFVIFLISSVLSLSAGSFQSTEAVIAGGIVSTVGLLVWGVTYAIVGTLAAAGINRNFGLSSGYTVLAFFFTPIWMSILAWGSARWIGPQPAVAAAGAAAPLGPPPPPPSAASNDSFVLSLGSATPPPPPPPPAPAPPAPPAPPAAPVVPAASVMAPPPPPPAPAPAQVAPTPIPATPRVEPSPSAGAAFAPPPAPPAPVAATPWQPPIDVVPGREVPSPGAAAPPPPPEALFAPPPIAPSAAPPSGSAPIAAPPASVSNPQANEADESDDENDRTVVVSRRRATWTLTGPDGTSTIISKPVVVVGRKPVRDPDYPDAQLVSVSDSTRTMSKNHARLRESDDGWFITDLASTNGVVVLDGGVETVVTPGLESPVADSFLLGEAQVRLSKDA